MSRYVLPLLAALALIPVFVLGLRSDPSVLPSQFVGKAAPVFDLPTLKDPSRRISDKNLIGSVSLMNIWATWCAGCRAEHDFLMQIAAEGSLPIYAINWRDNRQDALQWLQQLGDPYVASAYDENGRVGIDWGVYGAPETFLLSANGQVVYRYAGPLNRMLWEQEFVPRIKALSQ